MTHRYVMNDYGIKSLYDTLIEEYINETHNQRLSILNRLKDATIKWIKIYTSLAVFDTALIIFCIWLAITRADTTDVDILIVLSVIAGILLSVCICIIITNVQRRAGLQVEIRELERMHLINKKHSTESNTQGDGMVR